MSRNQGRLLFWSPRVLSILFAGLISIFALDVFDSSVGLWQMALDLSVHMIPTALAVAILVVAWRWEWVGTVVFAGLAALYTVIFLPRSPIAVLMVAVPMLVIAGLYLGSWIKRSELRLLH